MSCRSSKCERYDSMKELREIDGGGDGWCLSCKRFYPDQFMLKGTEEPKRDWITGDTVLPQEEQGDEEE